MITAAVVALLVSPSLASAELFTKLPPSGRNLEPVLEPVKGSM